MSTSTLALEIFDSGLTCSEAVAMAGMKRLGRQSDLIPRIATGFGGGLSRTKSVCGALTGGVLVLERGLWPRQAGRRPRRLGQQGADAS